MPGHCHCVLPLSGVNTIYTIVTTLVSINTPRFVCCGVCSISSELHFFKCCGYLQILYILPSSITVLSRASAHGRLQLTQEKLWVGAYAEEPFELLSYHCVRAHPPLTCTASVTTMKPLERMHALTPCKASVVLHRKPSLCMGS